MPETGYTTDPKDPRLKDASKGQQDVYLILPEEARKEQPYTRPLRYSYWHEKCERVTTMGRPIAETYARNPKFYGLTFCSGCNKHLDVDEFFWMDDKGDPSSDQVGS